MKTKKCGVAIMGYQNRADKLDKLSIGGGGNTQIRTICENRSCSKPTHPSHSSPSLEDILYIFHHHSQGPLLTESPPKMACHQQKANLNDTSGELSAGTSEITESLSPSKRA
jgi:hypothetical protein